MCDYCRIVDDHNTLKEIAVSEIDVGKFGKFELSTYISGFPYPALSLVWIYTDKDGIIQKDNTNRKEIKYCPMCGRKF